MGFKGPFNDSFISKLDARDRPHGWKSYSQARADYLDGEEKKLRRDISAYLNHVTPKPYVIESPQHKKNGARIGMADILICYRGRWVSVECKAGENKLSAEQINDMHAVRESGGYYILAHGVEDVRDMFRHIDGTVTIDA
jgi:hypothetical protein